MENKEITTDFKTQKVVVTMEEALELIFDNQISRQTLAKVMRREKWPVVSVCKKVFIPYSFVQNKIQEINQMGLAR